MLKLKEPPAEGARISETGLQCGNATGSLNNCTCFTQLDCANGVCTTLDESLKEIRDLATGKVKGLGLDCSYVETGTCEGMTYIYCDVGMGYHYRFFDAKKAMVGMNSKSDTMEYCDQQAAIKYSGVFHPCRERKNTKALFGKKR